MALSESCFIVKMRYRVKDTRNAPNTGDYKHWITPTSPGFSWVKNIRVEVNGQEVTQSSLVSDMQQLQHILSLMESLIGKLQYADSDLYGLQKLNTTKSLKALPLQTYDYSKDHPVGYAFETNAADDDDAVAPDFGANFTPK